MHNLLFVIRLFHIRSLVIDFSESVCWLVTGITSAENRKNGSFLRKIDSCFLIETKLICKLLYILLMENQCQDIPRLRLFMIFKNSSFPIIKISNLQNSKSSNFEISKIQKSGTQDFSKILRFSDSQISKIHIFQECSLIFSCIFWSKFMANRRFQGPLRVQKISKFWKFPESSKKYWDRSGIAF